MVALALRRRTNYRLFYLAHHFAIFFLVVAVVHAWTHWYYACGGLVLWFYDRLVRIVKRSRDPIQHENYCLLSLISGNLKKKEIF